MVDLVDDEREFRAAGLSRVLPRSVCRAARKSPSCSVSIAFNAVSWAPRHSSGLVTPAENVLRSRETTAGMALTGYLRGSHSGRPEPRGTRMVENAPGVADIRTWSVTPW